MPLIRAAATLAALLALTGLALTGLAPTAPAAAQSGRAAALDALAGGTASFPAGDTLAATRHWSEAIRLGQAGGGADIAAQALLRRGEAYRVEGYFRNAADDLRAALAAAEKSGDAKLVAAAAGALGSLALLAHRSADAEAFLLRSRGLAEAAHDPAVLAASDNDLGNFYATANRPAEALARYREAVAAAEAAGDQILAATAEINAARLDRNPRSSARSTRCSPPTTSTRWSSSPTMCCG